MQNEEGLLFSFSIHMYEETQLENRRTVIMAVNSWSYWTIDNGKFFYYSLNNELVIQENN